MLLAFELWPGPRPLYSASVSPVYDIVRADPRPVRLLELPFGVRDGVTSAGDFSARYQFHQTVHGKRLIGGYLSRVPERRFKEVRRLPTLAALITLSEGKTLTAEEQTALIEGAPQFIERSDLAWVVIHRSRTPPALRDFALRAFALDEVAADGDTVLYRTRLAPPAAK